MGLTIRHANGDGGELPVLLKLLPQLTTRPKSRGAKVPSRNRAQDILCELIGAPNIHLLVAELDGEIVGTVTMAIVPSLTYDGRPWAIIESVVVKKGYRRLGVGTQLMEFAHTMAGDKNCYKVQLISGRKVSQLRFYKSLGYKRKGYVAHRLYF